MDVMQTIKDHPVPIGIGVVILLILVISSRSSTPQSTGNNASAYLQSQKIAADSNAQMAGINSSVQIAIGAQSVERATASEKAATDRMSTAMGLFATLAGTNAQVSVNRDNNLVKTLQVSNNHSENVTTISNNYDLNKRSITANVNAHAQDLAAQKQAQEMDNNFRLAQVGAQTAATVSIIGAGSDAQMKSLPFQLHTAENIARINGTNALEMARVNGATSTQLAQINTQAANTRAAADARAENAKTSQSWISSIGNVVGSLFGL